MDDPPKRLRSLGFVGLIGYLALIIFIGGQVILSVRAGQPVVDFFFGAVPLWIVLGVLLLTCMLGFRRLFMIVRDRRVRQRTPGAVVYSAVRVIELAKAADSLPDERIVGIARKFPMQFSFVVHPDGDLDFWRAVPEFRSFLHIESAEIQGFRADVTQESGRITRCIVIGVGVLGAVVDLPIVVVGRGLFGSFPPKIAALERLARRISTPPGRDGVRTEVS
jgi:hypothetical protein